MSAKLQSKSTRLLYFILRSVAISLLIGGLLVAPVVFTPLVATRATLAPSNGPFPELKAKTLAGLEVNIPTTTMGKPTIIGLAFSPKAEADLKTWLQPMYDTFIAKQEGVFEAANYEGNFYMVAMLSGPASLATKSVQGKAAASVDKELAPHLIITKADPKLYLAALGAKETNRPYFAVLNLKGEIVYITSGPYTEEKLDELIEKAE
jgi:hypothetical protein